MNVLPHKHAFGMIVILGAAIAGLTSCTDNNAAPLVKAEKTTAGSGEAKTELVNPRVHYGIEGFYTGMFKATEYADGQVYLDNLITISIDSMNGKQVFGHSVVAGNVRWFSGSYTKDGNEYDMTVREPGDSKYDGQFTFTVYAMEQKLSGKWKSNDPKVNVTEREYELTPRTYQYNAASNLPEDVVGYQFDDTYKEEENEAEAITEDAIRFNASTVLLKNRDIENMYAADLEAMRNAIYARHGYSFKNKRMRNLFDNYVDWYMPLTNDVTPLLTELEQKNILLLKRYEKHASKYYDNYGR